MNNCIKRLTDEELLSLATSESQAFGVLYERHEATILAYFMRRTNNPEIAADLAAETFAVALESRRRFKSKKGTVIQWLIGIAKNKFAEFKRKGSVEERAHKRLGLERPSLNDHQLEQIIEISKSPAILNLLASLPDDQKDAIEERIINNKPYNLISEQTGYSSSVIRKRVSRGLAVIKSRLQER